MITYIEIKEWKKISVGIYKNTKTNFIIKEIKKDSYFEYYNQEKEYLGRYNSKYSIFNDNIILIALDSEY